MNAWDAEECGARHDVVTSITCHRPKDHSSDHEGISVVTWPKEDGESDA